MARNHWQACSILLAGVTTETLFDVVIDDEIQFPRREAVMPRQHPIHSVEEGFCDANNVNVLSDVLPRLGDWPTSRVAELAPAVWKVASEKHS